MWTTALIILRERGAIGSTPEAHSASKWQCNPGARDVLGQLNDVAEAILKLEREQGARVELANTAAGRTLSVHICAT